MIRISLSSLALAAALAAGVATPAQSETFQHNGQPVSCDCSNCSAEHCQGSGKNTTANTYTIVFIGGMAPGGTGFTTQPSAVDPSNPNVVYVGGSRR